MNKGFISWIFLASFINISVLASLLLQQINAEIKILESMKDVHERISFEALLIDKINCALSNKEDVEKITEVNGTGVWVTRDADRVEVEFLDYSIVLLINQDEQIREIELE